MNEVQAISASQPAIPSLPSLTTLVNITTLQHLQDRFAALGRMSVCICTTNGDPITKPMWGSRYSEMIGTSTLGRQVFFDAVRACLRDPNPEAEQKCLDGMSVHVVPIQRGDQMIASLAIATRRHNPPREDVVRQLAAKYGVDVEELLGAAVRLNPWRGGTPEAIHRFADVLAHIISTLYGQAERINRQLADLQTVYSMAQLLSGTVDLQAILDLTVQRVAEVMAVKACAIRLHNRQTDELVIKAVYNLSDEYLRKGPVLLRNSAIDSAAFAGQTVYIENAATDPRMRYPDNARREGIVSGLCVPLTYRGNTVGVLRVYTDRLYRFTGAEEALLLSIASQSAAAIVNARLYEERILAEKTQRQVQAAAQIQRRMLPSHAPAHAALTLGCVYDPTLAVGGDFYDFLSFPDGRLGVCIADVMGKGLPAAMLMSSIRASLRAHAGNGDDPATALQKVNVQMHTDTLVHEFATLVYCIFSADGRFLAYSNAGHPPPLLLRNDRFIELTEGGLAIGVEPEERFEQGSVRIEHGDALVMVTDGVMDAMDYHGEPFGKERLLAAIWRHRHLSADSLAKQILWDVRRFAGLADQSDDITVVVVRAN